MKKILTPIEAASNVIAQAMEANPYAYLMFSNIARRISGGVHPLTAAQTEFISLHKYAQGQQTPAVAGSSPAAAVSALPVVAGAPVKRGRGRPPKPVVAGAPVKRGRGRPPKPVVAGAPVKRGRGRPPKPVTLGPDGIPIKRGRGRPPKPVTLGSDGIPIKRGRGRPRKITSETEAARAIKVATGLPVVPEIPGDIPVTDAEVLSLKLGGEGLPPVLGAAAIL